MTVLWTDLAERDLIALIEHIAKDRPDNAVEIGREIFARTIALERFPRRGRPGRVEGTRELVLTPLPWLAIYEIAGENVVVLRVLHAAQEWPPSLVT